ncbi:hypothetical protein NUW54_g9693 [Trametes sanguinea]|uniref:Uncharacterized protein n=1 Tax=Trametes sanguinea TaxID=158606 RepID=A0ACC1P6E5_9APHY|nr:hypothetical protein NUW54_g9693 [Trametes sanguinea]
MRSRARPTPPTPPPGPRRRATILDISTCLGLMFYGVSTHQAYLFYYTEAKERSRALKVMLAVVLALQTVHCGLCMHANYAVLIGEAMSMEFPVQGGWSLNILSVFSYGPHLGVLLQLLWVFSLPDSWEPSLVGTHMHAATLMLTCPNVNSLVGSAVGHVPFVLRNAAHESHIFQLGATLWISSDALHMAAVAYLWALSYAEPALPGALCGSMSGSDNDELNYDQDGSYHHAIDPIHAQHGITSLFSLIFVVLWPTSLVSTSVEVVATNLYVVSLLSQLNSRQSLSGMDQPLIVCEANRTLVQVHARSSPNTGMFNSRSRRVSQGQNMSVHWNARPIQFPKITVTVTREVRYDDGLKGPESVWRVSDSVHLDPPIWSWLSQLAAALDFTDSSWDTSHDWSQGAMALYLFIIVRRRLSRALVKETRLATTFVSCRSPSAELNKSALLVFQIRDPAATDISFEPQRD